jgi:hypothetical protein
VDEKRILDSSQTFREYQGGLRAKKREAGRVVVQLWINAKWHADILKSGATLQDSADEAFALLHGQAARKISLALHVGAAPSRKGIPFSPLPSLTSLF